MQSKVNRASAARASIFVSGARPFLLWAFGGGLFVATFIYPLITAVTGVEIPFDASAAWPILAGVLGLGGARSYEKIKGVARNSMRD